LLLVYTDQSYQEQFRHSLSAMFIALKATRHSIFGY
jgi:hypothetical protein